jgi:hypothetical protein
VATEFDASPFSPVVEVGRGGRPARGSRGKSRSGSRSRPGLVGSPCRHGTCRRKSGNRSRSWSRHSQGRSRSRHPFGRCLECSGCRGLPLRTHKACFGRIRCRRDSCRASRTRCVRCLRRTSIAHARRSGHSCCRRRRRIPWEAKAGALRQRVGSARARAHGWTPGGSSDGRCRRSVLRYHPCSLHRICSRSPKRHCSTEGTFAGTPTWSPHSTGGSGRSPREGEVAVAP